MSPSTVKLRGITWNHTRGFLPMVATGQRYGELHPGVEITWERHPLKAFEDHPLQALAEDFDLIMLDHPGLSDAKGRQALLPLDGSLPAEFLADQAANCVGGSHATYFREGRQWALAVDAAAPVAAWREDLLAVPGHGVPADWAGLMALAREGRVEVPAAPINCLMNFYSLCLACGSRPLFGPEAVSERRAALAAVDLLRELLVLCEPGCWERNPIASLNLLADRENTRFAYCPLTYGYSNYAREGYAGRVLRFGQPPLVKGLALRTTLGGAGLGLSALRPHRDIALGYARFVADPNVQRSLYAFSGGQPGHRAAWLDPELNRHCGDYFRDTLPVLERAYVRPEYVGYLEFQKAASPLIHAALRRELPDAEALDRIDDLHRQHLHSCPARP